jgi:hypothetical protein
MIVPGNFTPTPFSFRIHIMIRCADFVILSGGVRCLPNKPPFFKVRMDVGRHDKHPCIFLAVSVTIPQDLGRKHFKPA